MRVKLAVIKSRVTPIVGTAVAVWLVLMFSQIIWNAYTHYKYQKMASQSIIKPTKVFQIGFSKCGTSTIAYFFNRNGVPAVHHDYGRLPSSIYENYVNGRPLISQQYQQALVFTDMEMLYKEPIVNVGVQYFKDLDQQYPGSKFILNTRKKAAWLKSRSKQLISPSNESLLEASARLQKITTQEMEQRWSQEWDDHHAAVKEYFKGRPHDLIVFDIENDSPERLVEFFKDDFKLSPSVYTAKNQTLYRGITKLWNKYFNSHKAVTFIDEEILRA